MPKTNAEYCRDYRKKKRENKMNQQPATPYSQFRRNRVAHEEFRNVDNMVKHLARNIDDDRCINIKIKKIAKSSTERVREFRARRKSLLNVENYSSTTNNDDFTVQNSESDHNDIPMDISNVQGDAIIENDIVNNDSTTTFNCSIFKNMDKLSDCNHTNSNENADMNYLIPVRSRAVAVHDIDVKVENDLSVNQGVIKTEDTIGYNMENRQTSPLYVAIDKIKVEYDEAVNQDLNDQENISSVIHDIMVENEDYNVECGSTTTKDFVTDDIKVEIIQEIIAPEEFTNIDTMCRSTLPTDVGVNSVKFENCGVMNQDASDSATNTDVKCGDALLGEDYSSVDDLPLAETIHKVEWSDTGVQLVKGDTRRQHTADDGLSVDDKLSRAYRNNTELTHITEHENCLQNQFKVRSGKVRYSCQVCHKIFDRKPNYTRHMRTHTGEKPYSCEICHKKFTQKCLLKPHMRIHSGEKPYSCGVCHKTFRHKGTLQRHMKMHLGERPFSCEVCHKKFIQKGQVTSHMRLHTGIKPYSCDICKNAFTIKRILLEHIRTHTKEKPFSCEICHKAFSKKSNCTSHMRTHTGEKPFSCDICDKSFISKAQLKSHWKTHSDNKTLKI